MQAALLLNRGADRDADQQGDSAHRRRANHYQQAALILVAVDWVPRPIHLFLFVKVRERWGEDPARYREMGLDYPKE